LDGPLVRRIAVCRNEPNFPGNSLKRFWYNLPKRSQIGMWRVEGEKAAVPFDGTKPIPDGCRPVGTRSGGAARFDETKPIRELLFVRECGRGLDGRATGVSPRLDSSTIISVFQD
jgi:hypothetical protein